MSDKKIKSNHHKGISRPEENRNNILRWGENCNITKWKEIMIRTLDSNYGINASFTEKGAYEEYDFPPLAVGADAHAKSMYALTCGKLMDDQRKLTNDRVSMWADILQNMSETSQDKVKEDPKFAEYRDDKKDVLGQWKIILKVHSAAQTGDPVQDRRIQREKIQNMKQGNTESLISFKKRLTDAYNVQKVLNEDVDPVSAEIKVQDFLSKLDPIRYREFNTRINTDVALKVQTYPANLNECVVTIEKFLNVNRSERINTETKKNIETIFITKNDDYNVKDNDANTKIKHKEGYDISKVKCFNCNKYGHYKSDCTKPAREKKKQSILVTIFKKDRTDLHLDLVKNFKASDNYVLIDSCASVSLFKNKNLLNNIRRTEVSHIIYGANATALTVNLEGDVPDFGTVLYSPDAIANILSLSSIEDKQQVIYKQGFGFTVYANADANVYDFQRLSDGIYACDVTVKPENILICYENIR